MYPVRRSSSRRTTASGARVRRGNVKWTIAPERKEAEGGKAGAGTDLVEAGSQNSAVEVVQFDLNARVRNGRSTFGFKHSSNLHRRNRARVCNQQSCSGRQSARVDPKCAWRVAQTVFIDEFHLLEPRNRAGDHKRRLKGVASQSCAV
jgi:hypothetical protein